MVEERNPKTGQFKYTTVFPEFAEVIDGNWSLVEMDFTIDFPKENEVNILIIGKELTADIPVYIDNLLILEKGKEFFENKILFEGVSYIRKNNHIQKDFYADIED